MYKKFNINFSENIFIFKLYCTCIIESTLKSSSFAIKKNILKPVESTIKVLF